MGFYYKGLDDNFCDLQTGKTRYTAGKVISIPIGERRKEFCKAGMLHASKNIFDIFKFIQPKTFCIVEGKPILEGKEKAGFHEYKVVKRLSSKEVSKLLNMNWDLRPITSFFTKVKNPTKEEIELLHEYIKVADSIRVPVSALVWGSINASVWSLVSDSVGYSVWDSVWCSVWYLVSGSVRDSIYAYLGSLFIGIKKWKRIKHKKGEYPFQAGAELIKRGFMPCTDGKFWYLLSGKAGTKWKIVYEEKLK